MAEMEEMEAMKRAYAEMILNTAREAAERVMAADMRARRKEQELSSVKEEAASLLLRLKQMVDAKTKEAEVTSMNQKKKFELLESQLNEAEGIILDLREELNQGKDRLHKLKKKQLHLKRKNEESAENPGVTGYEFVTSFLNPGPLSNVCIGDDQFRAFSAHESKTSTSMERVTSVLEEETQHGNGESVSIVRRSVGKRKLKFWDDVIAVCGLQSSNQVKIPPQGSSDPSRLGTECNPQIKSLDDAALPENMELVDVLVKEDELAATLELSSASRIDCDVEDGAVDEEASDLSHADDGNKLCKYTLNRKCRKKSVIYPEKVIDSSMS